MTMGTGCRWPGCREIVPFGQRPGYCAAHRGPADRSRGSAAARGYDRQWAVVAATVRREEPYCRFCLADGRYVASAHVDHITPKRDGGSDQRHNLRALCAACHRRRTATEQSGWTKGR